MRRAQRLVDRALGWRWAPLVSYLLLVACIAGTFALGEHREAQRRRDRYEVCVRAAAERQAIYDLLTVRPPRAGTPADVLAALERARRVFGEPTRCEELL